MADSESKKPAPTVVSPTAMQAGRDKIADGKKEVTDAAERLCAIYNNSHPEATLTHRRVAHGQHIEFRVGLRSGTK